MDGVRRVLVVAPHALDEALGCGGTLARHAGMQDSVTSLVLFGDSSGSAASRRDAASAAAQALGTPIPIFAGFPENQGDKVSSSALVGAVEAAISAHRPDLIYVPWGGGLHNDHRVTFQAAVTAARPVPGSSVRGLYAYEILSSTEWATGPAFRPTRFVDVAGTIDAKISAITCYPSDLRPVPHARSLDAVRALAIIRGASVGLAMAEAFETVREVVCGR